jgi:hypothetical protein
MATFASVEIAELIEQTSLERSPGIPSDGQWSVLIPPEQAPIEVRISAPNATPIFG